MTNDLDNLKVSKKKKIFRIVLLSILIIVGIIFFVFFNNREYYSFISALKINDIEKANVIYNVNKDNSKFLDKVNAFIDNEAEQIKKDYSAFKIDSESANNMLLAYGRFNDISEVRIYILQLSASRQSYEKALNSIKDNNTFHAIEMLQQVIEVDENYKDAQEKLKSLRNIYKTEVLNMAEVQFDNKNYAETINILVDSKMVLPSKEIEAIIKEVEYSINLEKQLFIDFIKNEINVEYDQIFDKYTIVPLGYSAKHINIGNGIHAEPRIVINKDKSITLINVFGYNNDSSISIKNIRISTDADLYEFNINEMNRSLKQIDSENILEWATVIHSDDVTNSLKTEVNLSDMYSFIEKHLYSDTIIRYSNFSYKDFTLSTVDKLNLINFYKLYTYLNNDIELFDTIINK